MTSLGEYLRSRSINKADVSRKTGISSARLSVLSNDKNTKLRAKEVYLIARAIGVAPGDILESIYGHLKINI